MLLVVRITYGGRFATNVPTSGTETWNSASVSSSTASSASSARSTSSISSTTGSSERIASSSGRAAQEPLGEEHALLRADPLDGLVQVGGVGDDLADLLAQDLGVEQLLAVVPLVERLGLVLALVALQPQQPAAGGRGQRLGQLGLADAGGALDEQRLVQPGHEEDRGREARVGDVAVLGQRVDDVVDGRRSRLVHGVLGSTGSCCSDPQLRARVAPARGRRPGRAVDVGGGSAEQVVQVAVHAVVHHRAHGLERALLGVARRAGVAEDVVGDAVDVRRVARDRPARSRRTSSGPGRAGSSSSCPA